MDLGVVANCRRTRCAGITTVAYGGESMFPRRLGDPGIQVQISRRLLTSANRSRHWAKVCRRCADGIAEEARAKAGIGENLIRLSVGLESSEDLVEDLLNALQAAAATQTMTPVAAVFG